MSSLSRDMTPKDRRNSCGHQLIFMQNESGRGVRITRQSQLRERLYGIEKGRVSLGVTLDIIKPQLFGGYARYIEIRGAQCEGKTRGGEM